MYKRAIPILIVLLLLVVGCTGWQVKPSPLTPQEQFLMKAEQIYIAQYNDYLAMSKNPNLSPEQKQVMATKYKILNEAEPLIKLYRSTVKIGEIPDPSTETQIYNLLTSIGGKF